MRVVMIGCGYVGLVSGACFSEFGHDVICVDNDKEKIEHLKHGKMTIYEPGLDALVRDNFVSGRLSFSTDLKRSMSNADAVFIAVGTPSRRGDGEADVSYVLAAAEEIATSLSGYTVVVSKSTVPVGTTRRIANVIRSRHPGADFDIASNPEFLREGSAINDFMRPDRVVVGTNSERARNTMRDLYRPLFLIETPVIFTSLESAELTKYAANTFLATKITFINEMADLCEKVGADVHDVARGMGLDRRIGSKFLHPGPGFGGSCFPKDTLALTHIAEAAGAPSRISETVVQVNRDRKKRMAKKIIDACGGDVNGATIAVLGLTFKPNTDDMREAPSLDIIPVLAEAGATLRLYDPEGMASAKEILDDVTWCEGSYEAVEGADAVAILTEWNQFRALDLIRIRNLMRKPVVIDLRNVYDPTTMAAAGFIYESVGRTCTQPE